MRRDINIHLITSLESGGAQKILYDYICSLDKVTISKIEIYSIKDRGFYKDKLESEGVEVIYLNKFSNWYRFFKSAIFSNGYMKAWMYHACFLSSISKLNVKKKIYWSIHHGMIDFDTDSKSTILFSLLSGLLSWFIPEKIIFVSKFCLKNHTRFFYSRKKSTVIYNMVSSKQAVSGNRLDRRTKIITFVGRYHPNKNIKLFFELCEKLEEFDEDIEFCIVGDGTEKLAGDIQSKGANNYHFMGEVSNIYDIYHNTRVYVCTSYVESFGLTIVESILSGCKVVCPDDEVYREVTENSVYYYQQDNLNDLFDKVKRALNDTDNDHMLIEKISHKYSYKMTAMKLAVLLGDKMPMD